MRVPRLLLFVAVAASPAQALMQAYSVEPVKAAWSGWTSGQAPGNRVSQTITCCWDELDSTCYVELFVGAPGDSSYNLEIKDVDGGQVVAEQAGVFPSKGHAWLKFDEIEMRTGESFTKGKTYEFRFSRSGSDSIEYFYQTDDPYKYGKLRLGGFEQTDRDLCMRAYGVMDAIEESYWSVNAMFPWWWWELDTADRARLWTEWDDQATSAQVGAARIDLDWHCIQFTDSTCWSYGIVDEMVAHLHDTDGMELIGTFIQCPKWASSSFGHESTGVADIRCPPVNLFLPVDDPSNYWAKFVAETVSRYKDSIDVWEIWNEANDNCTLRLENITGWWKIPNSFYSDTYREWPTGPCLLYVRLCWVADRIIDSLDPGARVLIGSVHNVDFRDSLETLNVGGKHWIDMCYDIAISLYGGVFWDGVSVHPYHDWNDDDPRPGFDPVFFEKEARVAREIMTDHEHYAELWNTEIGWNVAHDSISAAHNLAQMFVTSRASEALPV